MVEGVIHHAAEAVQLILQFINGIRAENEPDIGGDLPGDPPYVLASLHDPGIHTVFQVSGRTACHTAYIVAHMGIADSACVPAAAHHAVGKARDPAGVRGGVQDLLPVQAAETVLQALFFFLVYGIDRAFVGAAGDGAGVMPGDAAGDGALCRTAVNGARGLIDAGDPAHLALAFHGTLKGAVQKRPLVAPCNAAHAGLLSHCGHSAGHMEVTDHRALLNIAEQSLVRGSRLQGQTGNGVAVALKGAAEGGNGGKICTTQVNVRLQRHGLSP